MSLPKINYPINTITIPSSKKKIQFRPFLVKEEKLLLTAKVAKTVEDMFVAMIQIVNNCSLDPSFDVRELPLFDLEYIFIKLRAISINNIVEQIYTDNEDGKEYKFNIDLNKIEVEFPKEIKNTIKLNEDITIVMKYPQASLYENEEFLNSEDAAYFELMLNCVDKIFTKNEVYDVSTTSKKELSEFLESMSLNCFDKIKEFFLNRPTLKYEIKWTNSNGTERKVVLTSLQDFFTWD
jgi:hypothetical protein